MSFSVRTDSLGAVGSALGTQRNSLSHIKTGVEGVKRGIVFSGTVRSNVQNTMNSLIRELEQESSSYQNMSQSLNQVRNLYMSAERTASSVYSSAPIEIHQGQPLSGYTSAGEEGENTLSPGWDAVPETNIFTMLGEWLSEGEENEDIFSFIKKILKGFSEWEDDRSAGFLEKLFSYFEDLSGFLRGDMRGLTGASALCSLTSSSIETWKGLYDYFQNIYQGMHTGFFGDIAQKGVGYMGLSAGVISLISSVIDASDGLNEKNWPSIVAGYLDSGKDIVSVVNSAYDLKHLGDLKSLTNLKAGPWSAANVYAAIAESAIRSVSQGFRSYEKYMADGSWDMSDTGATGIDISMAGIYGISHSLTLGLDDVIFGTVEKLFGGSGNDDMTFYEKAAEGYKILARKAGEFIGNWWTKVTSGH